jgi:hypothetical protein
MEDFVRSCNRYDCKLNQAHATQIYSCSIYDDQRGAGHAAIQLTSIGYIYDDAHYIIPKDSSGQDIN